MQQFFLWSLAGVLMGSAHLYPVFLWPFALVGFLLFLQLTLSTQSYKQALIGGFMVGFLYSMFTVLWYWQAYPIPVLGPAFVYEQLFLIGVYWLYSSILLAVGPVLFSVFVQTVRTKDTLLLFLAPVVWVGSEVLGLFLYSLGTLGKGGVIGVNFGFALLGNIFSEVPFFVHSAVLLGAFGVSCISVLFLVSIFLLNKQIHARGSILVPAVTLFSVLFLVGVCFRLTYEYQPLSKVVLTIDTRFDKAFSTLEEGDAIRESALFEAVTKALEQNPDTIILPEDSRFFDYFETSEALFAWIHSVSPSFDGLLIDSGRVDLSEDKAVLRGYIFDTAGDHFTYTEKKFLVAQGEFISYVFELLLPHVLSNEVLTRVESRFAYEAGEAGTITESREDTPIILFCSESVVPYAVKFAVHKPKSGFVAHVVSHAWFSEPKAMWRQIDTMLTMQAVWNQMPIVGAVNAGEGKLYLPNGKRETGTVQSGGSYWVIRRFEL